MKKTKNNPEWFEEFYRSYPCSVIRPNGTKNYLRGNIAKARTLYNQIVGDDENQHRLLLKCLYRELADRTNNNSFQWMRFMINWLKEEEWKQWIDEDNNITKLENIVQYGTDVK